MKYDRESWKWLIAEFMRHATEIAVEHSISPARLFNWQQDKHHVYINGRRELIQRMREGYSQDMQRSVFVPIKFYHGVGPDKAIPISALVLADLCGCSRSDIYNANYQHVQKLRKEIATK